MGDDEQHNDESGDQIFEQTEVQRPPPACGAACGRRSPPRSIAYPEEEEPPLGCKFK
jgi:hypothetical protein